MSNVSMSLKLLQTIVQYTNNPVIPVQQVAILLHVLDRGEIPMHDLSDLVGVAQSSISRNVAVLGRGVTPTEPGYGLLTAEEDPFYRRRKLVRLTLMGEKLRAELRKIA